MKDSISLSAEWALRGKDPGSRNDYSILACSKDGYFRRVDFDTILTVFSSGTPIWPHSGAPSTWAIINWQGVSDKRYMGLGVSRFSDSVDEFGRPIVYTSYFCVPYKSMADSGLSFLDLYLTVEPLLLPVADGLPLELAIRRSASREDAPFIDSFDMKKVILTACLLLQGDPVTIVDAEQIDILDRIRFIESVMALLPYGFRAGLSAATWAESTSRHRIRLTFADRAPIDLDGETSRSVVRLATGSTSTSLGSYASQYAQWLEAMMSVETLRRLAGGGMSATTIRKLIDDLELPRKLAFGQCTTVF